jgi:hypothetical protein
MRSRHCVPKSGRSELESDRVGHRLGTARAPGQHLHGTSASPIRFSCSPGSGCPAGQFAREAGARPQRCATESPLTTYPEHSAASTHDLCQAAGPGFESQADTTRRYELAGSEKSLRLNALSVGRTRPVNMVTRLRRLRTLGASLSAVAATQGLADTYRSRSSLPVIRET